MDPAPPIDLRLAPRAISDGDLRQLALDLLLNVCAVDTARAFVNAWPERRENGVAKDADAMSIENGSTSNGHTHASSPLSETTLRQTAARRDIRAHIIAGRVQPAVELCNVHFPTILAPPAPTHIVNRPLVRPMAVDASSRRSSASTTAHPGKPHPPALLHFDLQIQAFIELVRTASAATAGSSSLSASMMLEPPDTNSDSPTSNNSASSVTSSNTLAVAPALAFVQKLNGAAHALPRPADRSHYLKALESVAGLLAYHKPEDSPVKHFLDHARRDVLADRLDAAILQSLGREPMPAIERIARQTTVVWGKLAENRIPLPAEKGKEKQRPKVRRRWSELTSQYPVAFDLDAFLSSAHLD